MRPNRPILMAAAAALALLVTVPPLVGQDQVSPRQIIGIYLAQDCGTGDPDPDLWLRRVLELGDRAVPILVEAVRLGPSDELREQVRSQAAEDFERLRRLVDQGGLDAIEEEEVVRLAEELDRSTYVEMRLRSFERPYRERALNALVAMKNPSARKSLGELASDPSLDPDLAEQAAEALDRDGRPQTL